jgi:hypothetical protein
MRPDDLFYCEQLKCLLRASACCRRMHKRINGTSEPYFPYCHEGCEQGCKVVKATGYVHHGNTQKGGMSEEEFAAHLTRRQVGRKRSQKSDQYDFVLKIPRTPGQFTPINGRPCVICGGDGCDFCLEWQ